MDSRARRSLNGSALLLLALAALAGCTTSIHDEAGAGNIERVRAMLDKDPALVSATNELGKTPLFYAITYGHLDVAQLLLDRGADVNATDATGLTPLHAAAWWTRTDRAGFLLDHGAHIEARDRFGDTPLHAAAMHGRLAMIDFLVKRGADLNAKNNDGLTPLELARRHRQPDAAQLIERLTAGTGARESGVRRQETE